MACKACSIVRQLALNWLLWVDKTGNTILLGNPNETISRRTARANDAGEKWAARVCRVLAAVFGAGHCENALQPGTIGTEIWAWSKPFSQPELVAPPAEDAP